MIDLRENISLAFESILAHRFRSFLTALGIIFGVAAVIAVVALGEGQRLKIMKEFENMGADLIWITTYYPQDETEAQNYQPENVSLTMDDLADIARRAPAVAEVAPIVDSSALVKYGNKSGQFQIRGTTPNGQVLESLRILKGQFFTDYDLKNRSQVAVLEDNAGLRRLFGLTDPVGKEIKIDEKTYQVIGLVEEASSRYGNQGGSLYMPITTLQKVQGWTEINLAYAKAQNAQAVEQAAKQIELILGQRYGAKKFSAYNMARYLKSTKRMLLVTALVIGGIAAISLLVGGIGIMNIMLVSVTERTREIGIRMAMGARPGDILTQFLIEAASLCLIGGIIGLPLGMGAGKILSIFIKIPSTTPYWAVLIGLGFSLAVGLVSGAYPAYRAAKLEPAQALRYE